MQYIAEKAVILISKEIIDGNSIIVLAQEEQEALNMAMEAEKPATK